MTYDLARIEVAVRAVAPDAEFDTADIDTGIRIIANAGGVRVFDDGRFAFSFGPMSNGRAIVRAVLDELDAQDAARGEGE